MSPRRAQFIAIAIALVFVAAIASILVMTLNPPDAAPLPEVTPSGEAQVLRDGAHLLTEPAEPEVTIVEFLDFQCPACAVASQAVAELKAAYGERVAIAVRHLPLTSIHPHAVDAALAFEAAAAQGATVEMYSALFATQQQWSSGSGSQAAVFRDLAEQLGLDLARYDRDVADPASLERIALDLSDAVGLGLQSTPSFFIDGERVQLSSFADLRTMVEQRLD